MSTRILSSLVLLTLLPAGQTYAATCTVIATGVVFGTYNPFVTAPLDSTGSITVTCVAIVSASETYTVNLSTGGAGTYSRTETSGAASLHYNLYTDSARSLIWGDGTGGTSYKTFSGTLAVGTNVTTYTVYGRMPAQQSAQLGAYSDAIVVTVNY
jgi:spore coat protein U-like protein